MPDDNGLATAWKGYDKERLAKRAMTREECDGKGLHWARARVGTRSDGEVAEDMAEWIDEVEARQNAEQADRSHKLAQRGVQAAEQSAISADKSADHAGTSARAALASTAISLFALVVAIAAYFKT